MRHVERRLDPHCAGERGVFHHFEHEPAEIVRGLDHLARSDVHAGEHAEAAEAPYGWHGDVVALPPRPPRPPRGSAQALRACSAASARMGVAATPPRPIKIDSTERAGLIRSAYATATPEMSSNRRLAILWNAVTGATGSGMRIVLISSSGCLTLCR